MKVLFICYLNVARSQMAEAIFNHLADGHSTAISAGVKPGDSSGKTIKELEPLVIECMNEIGIDVSHGVSKPLTQKIFDEADIVVSMIGKEWLPEYARHSRKVRYWHVDDPEHMTHAGKARTRDKIYSRVKRLIKEGNK